MGLLELNLCALLEKYPLENNHGGPYHCLFHNFVSFFLLLFSCQVAPQRNEKDQYIYASLSKNKPEPGVPDNERRLIPVGYLPTCVL